MLDQRSMSLKLHLLLPSTSLRGRAAFGLCLYMTLPPSVKDLCKERISLIAAFSF